MPADDFDGDAGAGAGEARLGATFRRLRGDDAAIARYLSDEVPAWQRAQARLVLTRVLGPAEARTLCTQAYGGDVLPGDGLGARSAPGLGARSADGFGSDGRSLSAEALRAQLLAAAASGRRVTQALGAADPAMAAAALRGLRDTSVPGQAAPALQLVARASDGAAARTLARQSEGAPLPADLAARFGTTVGDEAAHAARMHVDDAADLVAAAHRARAVTIGDDVYFARGEFAPGSARGDELIAHELAHVAQARRGELYRAAAKGIDSGGTLDASEAEADLQAKLAVIQLHPPAGATPTPAAPAGQSTTDAARAAQIAAQQQRMHLADGAAAPPEAAAAPPPATRAQAPVPHAPPPVTPAPTPPSTGNAYVDTFQAPPSKQATELWDKTGSAATTQASADSAKFDAELKPMPVTLDGAAAGNAKGGAGKHAPKAPPNAGAAPPAAAPTPTPGAPPTTAGAAAVQSVKPSEAKEQLKADGQKAIDNLPTDAPNVKTDPGPAPVTDLAGQSDPVRSLADQQHATGEGAAALDAEKKKVLAGPGAAQVQPLQLDEKMNVPKPAAEGTMPALPTVEGMAKMKKWNLPSNVQGSFDELAKPKLDAALTDAKGKMTTAEHKRDDDRTKAVADANDKVKQAHAEADQQQQSKVAETRTQIANHQADTLAKQQSKVTELDTQAGDKKKSTVGKINERIQSDQSKVEGDYQNAQKQAEDQKKKGEDDAAKKKADAQQKAKKDESWWEKAADAICDDIKAIADEIDKVLDAVVAAVGKILDAVKDAACKVIDAARDFVCAALTEFGDWLKSAVTALIGSVFPELAAALNALIDQAINAAKAAVNFIADKLKQGVRALCDGLKGAIDGIIAAFKAAVQAAATFAQAVVTGDWSKVGKMILDGILKLLGIDPGAFYALIGKAEDSIDKIIENPGAFVGHLVDAVKLGFKQFGANFWNHLKDGLVQWLFGTFAEAGIHMPAAFDIAGIFDLVAQVLGLTWTRMRGKVVKLIGEKNTERLEFVAKYVQALITGGFSGLWEKIKQDMSSLWDMVIGGVKQWIIEKVVQQAIIKIATMWNPAGAIIQLIETAWNVYQWVRENAQRIFGLIQAVVDSISNIVAGNISGAANWIEGALAKLVPMAISLFADLLGLGGIADKIRGIIEKVQTMVDNAIDKLIERVLAMFKGKDKDGDKDKDKADGASDSEVPKALAATGLPVIDKPSPAMIEAARKAKDGMVIYDKGGGDPKSVTQELLHEHQDAHFDKGNQTLTLPPVQKEALQTAASWQDVGAAVARATGVSKVILKVSGDELLIEGQINPITTVGKFSFADLAPDAGQKVLLLGEGNFSFAASLAKNLPNKGQGIVATSYDSHKDVNEKYKTAQGNIDSAKQDGAQVVHGVDAQNIDPNLGGPPPEFQFIVFNFPFVPGPRATAKTRNKDMLGNFMRSASKALAGGGKIYVTSKPYWLSRFELTESASQAGLTCQNPKSFDAEEFPGYEHRMTHEDAAASETGEAVTLIFSK